MRIAGVMCALAWAGLAAGRPPAKDTARLQSAFNERYRTGVRWMHDRQWQQADTAFAEALAYRDSPDARRLSRTCRFNLYLERGAMFLASGSYEDAVEQYQRALDLDSQNMPAVEGLRTAQYQAAFRDGMRLLSAHQEERARRSFERCIEIRPQDTAARLQLQLIDTAIRNANDWRLSWARVDACLAAQDAACLDRQVALLAGESSAIAPVPEGAPGASLMPAVLRYGRGDLDGAEAASRKASGPSAIRFRSLVREQMRWRFARRWAGWSAGLYGLTLLVGLYFGVRNVRLRQLAAPA